MAADSPDQLFLKSLSCVQLREISHKMGIDKIKRKKADMIEDILNYNNKSGYPSYKRTCQDLAYFQKLVDTIQTSSDVEPTAKSAVIANLWKRRCSWISYRQSF